MSSLSFFFFFFKQKTAYEMRISDWSSDVCSSDLGWPDRGQAVVGQCCLGEGTGEADTAPRNAHDFHLRPRQFGSRCRLWEIPVRGTSSQDGIVTPAIDGFGIPRTYGAHGGAAVYRRVAVGYDI